MQETVFHFKVAGLDRYQLPEVANRLKELLTLQLVRDVGNEYDPNAIEVFFEGNKLGFVNKDVAARLAPLLDKEGTVYRALVSDIDYSLSIYNQVSGVVAVFHED